MDYYATLIQMFCDADRRNSMINDFNKKCGVGGVNFIVPMSPTIESACLWEKEKPASVPADTD
jgi:hypothetical protein